ncbi:MAG TPA: alanine racemase [Longimicrobiales bacterium]
MSNDLCDRAWIEIDLDAVRENFETVRRAVDRRAAIIAMVKADAYGLGATRIARALEPLDPWGYGVATAAEGVELRDAGITRPILVVAPLPPPCVGDAARHALTASISDLEGLDRWAAAAEQVPGGLDFHVEIDTGMGRCGFDWRESARWGDAVRARCGPALRWTGVFTHFHGADARDDAATRTQWDRFQDALAQLPVSKEDLMVHAANSAAVFRHPSYAADAVRPGIFLYGGDPAPALRPGTIPRPRPVVAVRARLVLVRDVPPGSTVGYGAVYVSRSWERWGTLAIGYGDGFRREFGPTGAVLVRGRRAPIIGRISMDLTVVDLTGAPEVRVGDAATLIGRDGAAEITLEEVAGRGGTINYEVLTGLGPRLPRVERAAATES